MVVAVIRFSGLGRAAAVETRTAQLLAAMEDATYEILGEPVTLYYDPPWTLPFLRRNEVAVRVAPGADAAPIPADTSAGA